MIFKRKRKYRPIAWTTRRLMYSRSPFTILYVRGDNHAAIAQRILGNHAKLSHAYPDGSITAYSYTKKREARRSA